MDEQNLELLFRRYLEGNVTEEERKEFLELTGQPAMRQVLDELGQRYPVPESFQERLSDESSEQILQAIMASEGRRSAVGRIEDEGQETGGLVRLPAKGKRVTLNFRRVAAAVVLLVISGGAVYFLTRPHQGDGMAKTGIVNVPPGHKGALLKLGDGRMINLDSIKEGLVAQDGDITIYKEADGMLRYKGGGKKERKRGEGEDTGAGGVVGGSGEKTAVAGWGYNEVITARGQELTIQLPDGSTALLNAASSIRYPVRFGGGERRVTMNGEVFFKVKHDAANPFRVVTRGMVVEDIGTEFNVNAYDDEGDSRTTLLQGAVKINSTILRPGEQYANGIVEKVDTGDVVSWREGMFRFHSMDIQSIMRQVSRWYDVEVVYQGNIKETFGGSISRNVNLSEFLETLALTKKIKFTTDGKKITVSPYRD